MRAVLGIVAGVVAGFVVLILIGILGVGATYSVPAGTDIYDNAQVIRLLLAMPGAAKLALLAAVFGGALVGAALAKLIARRAWAAWTVAALVALYMALSVLALPLPGWMQALAIAAPLLGGLIGNHLVKGAPPVPDPAIED